MYKQDNKAFTLIELLVVIAIIGLLSTVVFTSLNQARQKGRDGRRVEDLGAIRQALELYYDDNNTYPSGLSTLVNDGYISVLPQDPKTESNYYYATANSGQDYVLRAQLENINHKALDNDVDGTPNGVNCNDNAGYYCIMP